MPPAPVGPDRLAPLVQALTAVRDAARAGAEELLEHYPELGDRDTQSSVDEVVDHAADLLRELDAAATELVGRFSVAARQAAPPGLDDRATVLDDDEVHR
jgi:hypothetical protein